MPRVTRNIGNSPLSTLSSALIGTARRSSRRSAIPTVPLAPVSNPGTVSDGSSAGVHPRLRVNSGVPAVPPLTTLLAANNLAAFRQRMDALANRPELTVNTLGVAHGHAIEAVKIPSVGPKSLSVVITAGVHGNEPCGPGAAMLLIDQLLAQPELRTGIEFTIIPMANPRAYASNNRRTPENIDMNRVFMNDDGLPKEVSIIKNSIDDGAYDLALDLHSGKASRNGFWTLHRNAENILAPALKKFGQRWNLLSGDTKPYTMSHPGVGTSKNKSTLKDFFIERGAKWSVTLEAPGSISYPAQVLGQNDMVHEILREARRQSATLA